VKLPAAPANAAPQTIKVTGTTTREVTDVLVGEVWMCSGQSNMPAWLHRATLFESTSAMRPEISHHRRKQLMTPDDSGETSSHWTEAIPHLDQAIDHLPESDRSLLLLHYFESRPFPKIAQALRKKPAAVQKQSQRALEKLARPPLFPALRSGHRLVQEPSSPMQFLSNNGI